MAGSSPVPAAVASSSVDQFLDAVQAGSMPASVFAPEAELDATVPNWRFTVKGREAVREQLGEWFADQGSFEQLARTRIPGGELVEFVLTWTEHGVPHTCHQAHILRLEDGLIASDTAFCGGRWPEGLVQRMRSRAG